MATLSPFAGWLVTPDAAPRVVTPAYDVMTPAERGQLAAAEPDSFLNVMRSPDDQLGDVPTDRESLLAASRHTLDRLMDAEAFRATEVPSFHVLRMQVGDQVQVGIVGTVPVADIGDTVRLHEDTRAAKEQDLVHHLEVVGVQSSPIGLVHPGPSPVADLLSEVTGRTPDLDLVQADGLHQQVWTVHRSDEVATIEDAFAELPALYLTDGHHRAASAVRFAERMRAAATEDGHPQDPDAPWEHVLVVAFPAPELRLHPYHRVVHGLGGRSPAEVRAALADRFELAPCDPASLETLAPRTFGVRLDGEWLRLTVAPVDADDPVEALDVTVLQERVLGPVLGIDDPRTDPRLAFVPGTLGLDELARRAGADGVAFALPPTAIGQLLAVADAGEVMPPKSTWFDPKLRSGMFLRSVRP